MVLFSIGNMAKTSDAQAADSHAADSHQAATFACTTRAAQVFAWYILVPISAAISIYASVLIVRFLVWLVSN